MKRLPARAAKRRLPIRCEATDAQYKSVAGNILYGIAQGTPFDQRAENVANTIDDAEAFFHEARILASLHFQAHRYDADLQRWGEISGASARTRYARRLLRRVARLSLGLAKRIVRNA